MECKRLLEVTVGQLAAPVKNSLVGGPFGSDLGTSDYVPSGVPVIRGQNLANGKFVGGEFVYVSDEKADRLKANLARPGDLLFTQRGNAVLHGGQVAIVPDGHFERYVVSQSQMKLTPDTTKVDSRFLYFVFSSDDFKHYLQSNAVVTGVPHINLGLLRDFSLSLPPLAEQKAIAGVLGALDDKIELNRRMNATLEAMARALFQSWFVDFDPVRAKLDGRHPPNLDPATAALFPDGFDHSPYGTVPSGWRVARWGELATLEYGKSIRDYRESRGRYRVFGTNGPIGFHDESLCSGEGIVIGRKGAYRGVHYSPEPFFVIDTAFYLKPKNALDIKWAYYELLRFDINGMDSGSAIPSTSRDDFYGIPVVVPPSGIQVAFGRIVSGWFAMVFANDNQAQTLANLRDAVLPKLLSGEIKTVNMGESLFDESEVQ